MVGVVHCIVAEFEIALAREVGFRDEHDVNVVLRDESLQPSTFSSYLLNVLLQLANKKWDSKQKKKHIQLR
jgi:hypothetical protein